MAFEKGKDKTGGREKGVENKLTREARELFVNTLAGQAKNLEDAFAKVYERDPAKYLELYAKYAQYFVPKKIDLTTDDQPLIAPVIQVLPINEDHE